MTRLILPLPPSVNHSHINVRRGRRLTRIRSEAANNFLTEAGWLSREWMQKSKWRMPSRKAKVIVRLWIYWPDRRKRDADNLLKVTLDAMKGILFEDDSQTLPRVMDFDVDKQNPRIEIELEAV